MRAFPAAVGRRSSISAALVHPADWPLDPDLLDDSVEGEALLYGAQAVHRQLVRWLERCGAREPSAPPTAAKRGGEQAASAGGV